ncbi:MAG: HlyC/CorC family transporter [Magnetococcales bacterium]|nr:HlyC/CorC family transporter [Magnetococcales bacterium]
MYDAIILLIMLILSGLFSGSETALTSVSMVRAEGMVKDGVRGAASLYALKKNTNRMLIALLIGNNLVNIGASAMATVLATEMLGSLGPGVAVGVLTLFILVFGEVTPKTFAARNASTISLVVAFPLLMFAKIAFPAVIVLEKFTIWLQKISSVKADPSVTESELISMAAQGAKEGIIDRAVHEKIERLFEFKDLCAADVMIPRHKIFSLPDSMSIKEALPHFLEHPYSRVPLHADTNPDEVVRVVFIRELLEHLATKGDEGRLFDIGHEPLFAPMNQPISELFEQLRVRKQRLVNVVDEFGSLQGLLTLEEIVEELVGEIYGELDYPSEHVRETRSGVLLVQGSAELRQLEKYFPKISFSGKPTDPVSRWVLNYCQRIPISREAFTIDGLEVQVRKVSATRINLLAIVRPEVTPTLQTNDSTTPQDPQHTTAGQNILLAGLPTEPTDRIATCK